jgi:hypothetical protein
MTNRPVISSATTSDARRSSTGRIAFATFVVFLVLAVGFVAVQVLPPTGPTYAVGMCLSGHVSDTEAASVQVVQCDEPHQYVVVKIIDPAVTLSSEICPEPYAGYIGFETSGLGEKWRHLLGDPRVYGKYACLEASA